MDTDFEIYKGKSFKDLCKDIYSNQITRKEQLEIAISELKSLIKTTNDALIMVPLIKGYIDSANVNDEHLIRLAAILQKIMTAQQVAVDCAAYSLTEEEKKELMAEINSIKSSDTVIVKKIESR